MFFFFGGFRQAKGESEPSMDNTDILSGRRHDPNALKVCVLVYLLELYIRFMLFMVSTFLLMFPLRLFSSWYFS